VLVINNGVIVADNTPEALQSSVAGARKYTVRVAGTKDAAARVLKNIDGVKYCEYLSAGEQGASDFMLEARENVDIRKGMFNALAKEGMPILMLRPLGASLEEIFVQLVTGDTHAAPAEEKEELKQ